MSYYASFQGRVYLGERNINGEPINVRSPGNVANLSLSLKTDVIEHYESQTGQRAVDLRLVKQKSATVALTIEEFHQGEPVARTLWQPCHRCRRQRHQRTGRRGGTRGRRPLLPRAPEGVGPDCGGFAGTPATLTAGTHFTADEDFGAIQFLDVTGLTALFKASYTFGAVTEIGILTQPLPERFLRLEG